MKDGEELLTIIIISNNEEVFHSFICKNTQKFRSVEDRIYEVFPEYEDIEKHFTIKGRKVKESKTLKENAIKNSDIIIMSPIVIS